MLFACCVAMCRAGDGRRCDTGRLNRYQNKGVGFAKASALVSATPFF